MIQEHYLQAIGDGKFSFAVSVGVPGLIVGALALLAIAFASYRRPTRPISRRWKFGLIALRSATLLVLGFCLLEPGVLVSEVLPQESYLAVLVDDSQSMGISDRDNLPSRHEQSLELLYGHENVIERLSEQFQLRSYRFSNAAQRLAGPEALTLEGTRSALGLSMEQVINELASFPLAGMVVVSDGADNGDVDTLQSLQPLVDKKIPIYSVALGETEIKKDLKVMQVDAAKSLLQDSIHRVQVTVRQRGYQGQRARLRISRGGRVVAEQSVVLPKDGSAERYTLELNPEDREILVYQLSLEEKPGEVIEQNNRHTFFIDNREQQPLDILYVEGQPRNEYKFIRRAVQDDPSLRLATYLQTGPRKFLRQGINSPEELSQGFPRDAEALFRYEAIVFGNVDRGMFDEQQLRLLQDFVAKRGGGFMSVGGLNEAFIDSPLEELLPLTLLYESRLPSYLQGGPRRGDHPTGREFTARLTRDGQYSPILRLDARDDKNRERWRRMPNLQGVYVAGRAKPGASVLIEHPTLTYNNAALPVLSIQRYGAGRSMALATASSWRWQMMMPHEDESHQQLWRQMLRWLSTESRQRLTFALNQDNYSVGDTVEVAATLRDKQFEADNNGLLWLEIKDPRGEVQELPMNWQLEKEGRYTRSFRVEHEGVYDLTVKVPSELSDDLRARGPLIVNPSRQEFLNAATDEALMRRLAESTSGRFYTAQNVHRLVDDVTFTPNAYSTLEMHSIWDEPLFLYLLIVLVSLEWCARRYKGLS